MSTKCKCGNFYNDERRQPTIGGCTECTGTETASTGYPTVIVSTGVKCGRDMNGGFCTRADCSVCYKHGGDLIGPDGRVVQPYQITMSSPGFLVRTADAKVACTVSVRVLVLEGKPTKCVIVVPLDICSTVSVARSAYSPHATTKPGVCTDIACQTCYDGGIYISCDSGRFNLYSTAGVVDSAPIPAPGNTIELGRTFVVFLVNVGTQYGEPTRFYALVPQP